MATATTIRISPETAQQIKTALAPLIGVQLSVLKIPIAALGAFEPSQIGAIVGTLMDACIPHLDDIPRVGLSKHAGILGEREGYPDYKHDQLGVRLELKLLYVDNADLPMKKPPTAREPSARLTQKVTVKNVQPDTDVMLLAAYRLQPRTDDTALASPTIVDIEVLSMIELVESRDARLIASNGIWFGNYETPVVPSKIGRRKLALGQQLDTTTYGRKEHEGKDFNEDTNFGKLRRIPHVGLKAFLAKYRGVGPLDDADDDDD